MKERSVINIKYPFLLLFLIFSFIVEAKTDSKDSNSKVYESTSDLTFSNPKISNSDILFSQFGGSATVITEYDIKKSGASDVQELLRKIPGLSVKQSGGRGGIVSIFSRGSESDHNLVIIDGVKVNEIGGYYDFSRLSVNNIEQIEVLRGPQAALYGPGAMGSVISIKTKKYNEKNTVSFSAALGFGESPSRGLQSNGGTYFTNEESINISGPISINKNNDYLKFGYSVGFKRIDDNGHMLKNNSHDKADLNAGLSLFTADNKLKVQASFGKKKVKYHYPTDSSGNTEGTPFLNTQKDRRHITSRAINLEYKVAEPLTLGTTYKYWYMHKWIESGYQAWNGVETNSDTNFWEKREGFDYYAKHSKNFNTISVDTLIGYDSTMESSDYNAYGGTYYGHDDKITQYYGNINFQLPHEISINPGIRKIHHETHGGYSLPSVFLSKNFSQTLTRVRGGFSKGVKYPNTYESYSQSYMLRPERQKSYEMRDIIDQVFDINSFFEMTKFFGRGIITGFARINGYAVAIFANDSNFYAGSMSAEGAQKTTRFIKLCDTFNIPIVSLVDEPGFLIGPDAEKDGTILHGTQAVLACTESTVPWSTIMIRKSFGVAAAAHYGPDGYVLAWPSSESGPLPLEGGVAVAFKKEIAAAKDPEAKRNELESKMAKNQNPFPKAEAFSVHEIIDPRETRKYLSLWAERIQQQLKASLIK